MQPTVTDVPDKKEIVSGVYDMPSTQVNRFLSSITIIPD